jgi:hypothetical protein
LWKGSTVSWAAACAEVDRRTVYSCQKDDPAFVAAMDTCRVSTADRVKRQLLAAPPKAATAIANAAEKGDVRSSLVLLSVLGLLAPAGPGRKAE